MAGQPETMAEWVARWQRLGPVLEQERATEFAATNPLDVIAAFDGMLRASLQSHPPSPDSGLIEQQRWFQKMRHQQAAKYVQPT
jgi:hypothetical protein